MKDTGLTTRSKVVGTYTWSDGGVYNGNFVHDKMSGKGRMTFSDGVTYDGEWKDGNFQRGDITWLDGKRYSGKALPLLHDGDINYLSGTETGGDDE
jgi:hypothetical protein